MLRAQTDSEDLSAPAESKAFPNMDSPEHDFVVLGDEDVAGTDATGLLPLPLDQIEEIRTWLQPTDYSTESSEYKRHFLSSAPGTGTWKREPQYQEWKTSKTNGTLWMKAIPGAGKSVIAARLVSDLSQDDRGPVLHFFFRQIIASNRTPDFLLHDWIAQLLIYCPSLQSALNGYLEERRSLESISVDELWHQLETALCNLPGVYCIADALDEMSLGNDSFFGRLTGLGQLKPDTIKLFMTSRPLPRIEKIFKNKSILQITLGKHLVDQDIAIYVEHHLAASGLPEGIRMDVRQALMAKSQGLFLYTKLTMDDILAHNGFDFSQKMGAQKALDRMPNCLAEMYTKMLNDHSVRSGVSQPLQLELLRWVTHSCRPLRLLEIAAMVDSLPNKFSVDLDATSLRSSASTKSVIRIACGPLLEILDDETVSIIHHSFTEYLTELDRVKPETKGDSFPSIDPATSHVEMAITCIQYLNTDWDDGFEFDSKSLGRYGIGNLPPPIVALYMQRPFLRYASAYWPYHAKEAGHADKRLQRQLDQLFSADSTKFLSWQQLRITEAITTRSLRHHVAGSTPLHVVADEGLSFFVEHLIELGHGINDVDSYGWTPMHQAAANGHSRVIKLLMKHGADLDPDDNAGHKPLHLAAFHNHASVVKALLESGVNPKAPEASKDPRARGGDQPRALENTAVMYACEYGHTEAALEFIPYLSPEDLNHAVTCAAEYGNSDIVLALLETGKAQINTVTDGKTLVYLAAYSHNLDLLTKLLSLGADVGIRCNSLFGKRWHWRVNSDNEEKSTPLHALTRDLSSHCGEFGNFGAILDSLLESGSDINATDATGSTPLHLAIRNDVYSHRTGLGIIPDLLKNGANVSAITDAGCQPLHLATSNSAIVRSLLEHGAEVNALNPISGRTPLHYSIKVWLTDGLLTLGEYGADCNAQDQNGDTPLHLSLQGDLSKTVVEALLNNGADPNIRNRNGKTPLHCMTDTQDLDEVLPLLTEAGANLEAKTPGGNTVLMTLLPKCDTIYFSITLTTFLKAGARLDNRDDSGRTILHQLCECSPSEVISTLVEAGADPGTSDFEGNTLMHYAARLTPGYHREGQFELFELILKFGIDAKAKNNLGQSPLHIAVGFSVSDRDRRPGPAEFLMGPRCQCDVNATDNRNVRPIHVAATLSEHRVRQLLDKGAYPDALTSERQSALHIACRARQSNIVGLLTELYLSIGSLNLIDTVDREGRTALHYACRSGRIESVRILLGVGAKPNVADHKGMTPLDTCAEFAGDDYHWHLESMCGERKRFMDAAYMMLGDHHRPRRRDHRRSPDSSLTQEMSSEHDGVGIRYIVRLLIAHGADVSTRAAPATSTFGDLPKNNHLNRAIDSACEILLDELLSEIDKSEQFGTRFQDGRSMKQCTSPRKLYLERYLCLRSSQAHTVLDDMVQTGQEDVNNIFKILLRAEDERGVLNFWDLCIDLLPPFSGRRAALRTLTQWGYADLLAMVGCNREIMDERLMLSNEEKDTASSRSSGRFLRIACERSLPNIEVTKVLVEKIGVDVNAVDVSNHHRSRVTALHILAKSTHWWNTEALRYLLDHGANVNATDFKGVTPLRVAVDNKSLKSVGILLRGGADPNILDEDSLTCLNKAGSSQRLARLLIEHGADVTAGARPFIFDAVVAMDVDMISFLVRSGIDCNAPRLLDTEEIQRGRSRRRIWKETRDTSENASSIQSAASGEHNTGGERESLETFDEDDYARRYAFPIHYASWGEHNTGEKRGKMIPVIEALLQGGADPLRFYNETDRILHDLCDRDGIIEPFLQMSNLDIEARDSHGRTLFLAACSRSKRWYCDEELVEHLCNLPSPANLLLAHGADVEAVNNKKSNALQCILSSESSSFSDGLKILRRDFNLLMSSLSAQRLVAHVDVDGMTALLYALQNQYLWAVDDLLAKGADPFVTDQMGNTALHLLSRCITRDESAKHCFDKFLSLGIPIDAHNLARESPLFVFMPHEIDCLKGLPVFVDAGADFFMINAKGQGLLHAVARSKPECEDYTDEDPAGASVEVFQWLMRKGLDPAMEDREQRTPLDLAVAAGNQHILKLFEREV